MKSFPFILTFGFLCSCDQRSQHQKTLDYVDSLKFAIKVDSIVQKKITDAMLDTTGLYSAPIIVVKARLVTREYSNYKDISLTYKNISGKDISAVRFSWHGLNAFGEPADMGTSLERGFGGGFSDGKLRSGKTVTKEWSILSRDGKKITLAWPTEVAFVDGTKWELIK